MKIAITGNIGSGKSTVVKLLRTYLKNFKFFDIDEIVHDLYEEDETYQAVLLQMFGTVDRKSISDMVFDDPELRSQLEDATKFSIQKHIVKMHAQPFIVVEFPLLFEMRCAADYDLVICCYVDDDIQKARVMSRDGITEEKFNKIRSAQLSTELKKALSHVAIDTNCSIGELGKRIEYHIDFINNEYFKERFINLFDKEQKDAANTLLEELLKRYKESHRQPHGIDHIKSMMHLLNELVDQFYYPRLVELAIWFHDIVYDIPADKYPLNEIKSAQMMFDILNDTFPGIEKAITDGLPDLAVIAEFILCTKGHQIKSPFILGNAKLLHDCGMFLDIDLSIFSADAATVEKYDYGIRNEFQIYPDEVYYPARVDVLKSFLDRDQIYFSEAFKNKESVARENLARLVEKNKEV